MESSRARWWSAGLIAGAAGLATSYLVASLMSIRESPVVAVADLVIRHTPGPIARTAIDVLGHADKPALLIGILVIMGAVFAGLGSLSRTNWWAPAIGYAVLAGGRRVRRAVAQRRPRHRRTAGRDRLRHLADRAVGAHRAAAPGARAARRRRRDSDRSRRGFLIGAGAMAGVAGLLAVIGRVVGGGRRKVEEIRGC